MIDGAYGKELVFDLHECNPALFNRRAIKSFMVRLCELIDMEREDLHFWDDLETPEEEKETEPHLVGTSAIQFIRTSNVTIHTLDLLERAYINIFSCKDFDAEAAAAWCAHFFQGRIVNKTVLARK